MLIGEIDLSQKVLIVAEIGNNHEGNFEVAQELVRRATDAGVDAVKFQTFRTEKYVNPAQTERFRQIKSYELSFEQFAELRALAHSLGLLFISTPLDLDSADFLARTADAIKIASGDNNFYPLISRAVESGLPLVISTGASDLADVTRTVDFVKSQQVSQNCPAQLTLLHCVSAYPVPPEQVNLNAIPLLARQFDCPVGYSDHTLGIEAAVLAVAAGAQIVEKHFTLDKNYSDFRDHQLSADPPEMAELVRRVRAASAMTGRAQKVIQPCEIELGPAIRRSVCAGRDLAAGHPLEWADILWFRPAGGIPPGEEDAVLGRKLRHAVAAGAQLHREDVE